MKFNLSYYCGKRVLVTGHTGFKGAWLCRMLTLAGAEVTGYALEPPTDPSVFRLVNIEADIRSEIGDIADLPHLQKVFSETKPEIVLHLAAQPIVRESYKNPAETYRVNVLGTVDLLECVRQCGSVRSVVNVTTDKVYRNNEWCWGYRETDPLDGFDPYSNSKSCSELVSRCFRDCFFTAPDGTLKIPISTVRAGNVIGGGDFAADRIIPDCVRAAVRKEPIIIRNPRSTRPFQHVLEPLYVYLMIAALQAQNPELSGSYNVGPADDSCCRIADLAAGFAAEWGEGLRAEIQPDNGPHEANLLRLDCAKLRAAFDWSPAWNLGTAIRQTAEWYRCWYENGDLSALTDRQIQKYLEDRNHGGMEK